MNLPVPRKNAQADDVAIAEICAWLKREKLTGHVTLTGKIELTPTDELYTELLFRKRGQS